jgi:GrpB-like predicted nucleotidyltransferase (UPF0157 family)
MGRPLEVVLSPHDPAWAALFEKEGARLKAGLAPYALAVEHIGSTAVPGIAAKATIDIDVAIFRLSDAPACIERMKALGYEYVPEFEEQVPERRYFRVLSRGAAPAEDLFHVHMVEAGNEWMERDLLFRDYLRSRPEAAKEYEALKRSLAAAHGAARDAYTDGKREFVLRTVEAARAERARARALTPPTASAGARLRP